MNIPSLFKNLSAGVAGGGLFRTKPAAHIVSDIEDPGTHLVRALGPIQLTLIGIGAIIGAGIFLTIGTAAAGDAQRPGAGPALMVSFVITAIVCGFTALCYAEFASMIPVSGSAYTYSYASLGELIAWVIGWDLTIEYAVGNIGVAISWANYFNKFLETLRPGWLPADKTFKVPDWLSLDYKTAASRGVLENAPYHLFGYPVVFNLLAVAIVVVITVILVWGIRESARFNALMVGIKILVLTFFIVVGLGWLQPANWEPFMPNGWAGVSTGAAVVFFAYIGFDAVSTVAEETKNPQRNLPIGIIASLVVCTIFYVAVSAVFTGLIPYKVLAEKNLEQAEPLTLALEYANPNATWAVGIVAFGSVVAHTAVLLVFQLGQPRIFMAMARDGLLPPVFARIHPRFRTPYVGTILTGIFVAAIAGVANVSDMVDLTNIGTLFAFILVCAGIIVLKVKEPGRERRFRVPSGWAWTLLLYAGFACGVVLVSLPTGKEPSSLEPGTIAGMACALGLGAVVFALCRRHIFPVLGVLSCLYLIYYLPPTSWLRFAAWLNVGFLIYVGYGSVHSRLTGRHLSERPAEHDTQTARVGALLGILGTGLLVFMRAFDLWLQGWGFFKGLPVAERVQWGFKLAAWPEAWLQGRPWFIPEFLRTQAIGFITLPPASSGSFVFPVMGIPQKHWGLLDLLQTELFWFLLLPLGLTALVLCPAVVRRGLRAGRKDRSGQGGQVPVGSIIAATSLALAILLYFFFIARNGLTEW